MKLHIVYWLGALALPTLAAAHEPPARPLAAVLEQAKTLKKPVLLDFGTVW